MLIINVSINVSASVRVNASVSVNVSIHAATNHTLHRYCEACLGVQELIRNQRKTNNGEDFPVEFLTEIYHRIR